MDSRDDIHYANDVHIYEQDHYNSDALYADDYAGYGLLDYDYDDSDEVSVSRQQEKYTIWKEDALGRQRQEDYMTRINSSQLVSRNRANEDEVCKALGVLDIFNTNTKKAEDNRKIKRCPAPGCDFAIEFHHSSGGYDVTCSCSYSFCWNCTEEAHRPVDCVTVSKWKLERSTESENMKLNLADSKACPKCKGKIEKRKSGCMHMTCKCKYEFCWVCLGEWSDHTGGLYSCNRYETYEGGKEMRYTHYYERWATHESSRQKAVSDLQAVDLERLSEKLNIGKAYLKFIIKAWLQVVECRRVLKWSYVYGYYLPEQQAVKRHFFEHLQGEAEVGLERLHECAEKYLEYASQDDVTRNYFDNFVSALENGLSDVDTHTEQQLC